MKWYEVGGMHGVDKDNCIVGGNYKGIEINDNCRIEADLSITVKHKHLEDYPIMLYKMNNIVNGLSYKEIKEVIFNNPATIIVWQDGTKTVVKCQDGDTYDKEKGFLLCYLKGVVGNKTLLKELDRWVYGK